MTDALVSIKSLDVMLPEKKRVFLQLFLFSGLKGLLQ